MATNTFKFGNGNWAVKDGSVLAYNDENNNFKPLPFDFTRDSIATRVNRDGLIEVVPNNMPRIDFTDNTDGHLLLEPSRTNIVFYSEELDNSVWNKLTNTTVTANQIVSPDGSQNADEFSATSTSTSLMAVQDSFSVSSSVDYVISFFAKKGSVRYVQLFNGTGQVTGNPRTNFDLQDGNVAIQDGGHTSSIEDFGNGWYRCTTKVTTLSTALQMYINGVSTSTASRSSSSSWTSGDNFYVWGAQIEAGSYATSYIPTEGSSVPRVREICEQDSLSNLIGQTEGVIYYDYTATFEAPSTSFDFFPISVSDGTTSNFFFLNNYNQALTVGYKVSGSSIISNNSFTFNSGDRIKVAFAYKQNDFAVYINGTQILTLSSGSVASLSEVTLGNYFNNQISLQDDVKVNELRFYNTRLTNTELQNLTS